MPIDLHAAFIRKSFHGNQLGRTDEDHLVGIQGVQHGTETITSTAASTLMVGGTSILMATASGVYTLPVPVAGRVGIPKRLFNNSAVAQYVKLATGNFVHAALSSNNTLQLVARGAMVDLEYLTTALLGVAGSSQSTAVAAFTTTT